MGSQSDFREAMVTVRQRMKKDESVGREKSRVQWDWVLGEDQAICLCFSCMVSDAKISFPSP